MIFYDENGQEICKIGDNSENLLTKSIEMHSNETIVGVRGILDYYYFKEFQFVVARQVSARNEWTIFDF